MRLVVVGLPFLLVVGSDGHNVTLRACVNFMSSYAGSWLATRELVKSTNFEDRQALEFATRDMYNLARGKKGTGWKTNEPISDLLVVHLSVRFRLYPTPE